MWTDAIFVAFQATASCWSIACTDTNQNDFRGRKTSSVRTTLILPWPDWTMSSLHLEIRAYPCCENVHTPRALRTFGPRLIRHTNTVTALCLPSRQSLIPSSSLFCRIEGALSCARICELVELHSSFFLRRFPFLLHPLVHILSRA